MRRQVQESALRRSTLQDRAAQTLEVGVRTYSVQTELSGIDTELRTNRHREVKAVQVVPHMTDTQVQVEMAVTGSVTGTQPHATPLNQGNTDDGEGSKRDEGSEESELSDVEEEVEGEEEVVDTSSDDADDTPTSSNLVMASGGTAVRGLTQVVLTVCIACDWPIFLLNFV